MDKQKQNIIWQEKVQIFAGKKVVGYVLDGTFYKSLKSSKHFLRKPPAIAFDVQSLRDARAAGASKAQIIDQDTGTIYRASIDRIMKDGWTFNRGFGNQIALPMEGWTRTKKGGGLLTWQESLFGEAVQGG